MNDREYNGNLINDLYALGAKVVEQYQPKSVREQLQAALDLLGPNGENWGHTRAERSDGKPCAMQACDRVKTDDYPLREVLALRYRDGLLCKFNDAPERTFGEIKDLFREAIAKAENPPHDWHQLSPKEVSDGVMRELAASDRGVQGEEE